MTEEYNREPSMGSAQASGVFEDFKAMPLEQKISSLFRMEIETLNEMLHKGADCAMSAFQAVGDAISGFGTKLEHEAKAAADANKSDESPSGETATYKTSQTDYEPMSEPTAYPTDPGYTPPDRSGNPFD